MSEVLSRIPRNLPVIQLNNVVMFPYLMIPLVISDDNLKKVIDFSLSNDKLLGIFLANKSEESDEPGIHDIGTAVTILRMLRNQDGTISLLLQGVSRIRVEKITQTEPFISVDVEAIKELEVSNSRIMALKKISTELLEQLLYESNDINRELIYGLRNVKQPGRVADIVTGNVALEVEQKQEILETLDVSKRFEKLNKFLAELIKQMKMENAIRNNIQLEMDEDQRKHYLREQLEAIKKELGEGDEVVLEITRWQERIKQAKLPEHVYKEAQEELERLSMVPPVSSEYTIIRNYLEWIVNLPWTRMSKDRFDMEKIKKILEMDHYGLKESKERVLEFIAVKKLNKNLKSPILCFIGPPGVGKTSFGRSIARALNKKFVRLSLGGIHDEAEIRGHRRTYVGALPGKILIELKRANTSNPLFMLDEIDKIGRDFRGDPASALLEVLDPEQNFEFMDNYINLPFDLSQVMFITTANSRDTIPPPLLDRMEIIEFTSYVEEEKVFIAQKYLVPKEVKNNGLTGRNIKFNKSAHQEIIRYYVREAGVRSLQREIAKIARKVAKKIAEGESKFYSISAKDIKDFLGRRKFSMELANRKPEIGVVTGVAWTAFGGEILFCESSCMPGKGKLILTGLLGEIMKESAHIGYSYIKSNYDAFKLDKNRFENIDIHIHLPAGAVPKDGPSAGVTLTTSILSLLTAKKVRHDIAMTGEITLRGKILPIGGLKEKLLAAKRSGIKELILPQENKDAYEDIDQEIRKGIKVSFVGQFEEVLKQVMEPLPI